MTFLALSIFVTALIGLLLWFLKLRAYRVNQASQEALEDAAYDQLLRSIAKGCPYIPTLYSVRYVTGSFVDHDHYDSLALFILEAESEPLTEEEIYYAP